MSYDGTIAKLLDPGDASHAVTLSESNRFFVDNASRIDGAPSAVLYDTLGNLVSKLETPDLSALNEAGFKFPEPFKVKADDGVTDLYGVMYKPFDFDPNKKYPIIAFVSAGWWLCVGLVWTALIHRGLSPRSRRSFAGGRDA